LIQGQRVRLRPVEEDDYPLIVRWQNEPQVFHDMDYELPFSIEDVRASETAAREEGHPFIIEADDGTPIGRIGLNDFRRRDRRCALYVFIGEAEYRGHGLGEDAVRTLVGFAFSQMDLWQVVLWGLADNETAFRTYERVGFKRDGVLRDRSWKGGAWVDHIVMSVQRDEYVGTPASNA